MSFDKILDLTAEDVFLAFIAKGTRLNSFRPETSLKNHLSGPSPPPPRSVLPSIQTLTPPRGTLMKSSQFVAEEVRLLLAELGFKSLDEAIGRADVLSTRSDVPLAKTGGMLDLDFITNLPDVSQDRLAHTVSILHLFSQR